MSEQSDGHDEQEDSLKSMGLLMDIPLKVSVELGRSNIVLRELLQIGKGAVLELDKFAGESLEVLVGGRPISRGEVVVLNEHYGIRLTDVIDPLDVQTKGTY